MARPALRAKGSLPHVALDAGTGFRVAIVGDLRPKAPPPTTEGWTSLFNGRNLAGWKPGQGVWRVDGNDLIGEKGPGYLFSAKSYENFELRVVARINAEGNSGVSFRRQLQAEMRNDPLCPIGSLLEITPTKTTTLIAYPPVTLPEGEWFTLEIRTQGNSISVRVNDGPWLSARDDRPAGARSAPLQLEAADLNSVVQFRKIEIRELPPETEDRRPSPTDD
jgi:hypothetical protein